MSTQTNSLMLRWRGQISGPYSPEALRRMLDDGEISLMHEVQKGGRWMELEELAEQLGWLAHPAPAKPPQSAPPRPQVPSASQPQPEGPPPAPPSAFPGVKPFLPPPPPAEEILVAKDGRQQGPYSRDQVRQLMQAGLLGAHDLGWVQGAPSWVPLSQLMGGILPPPPPGPFPAAGAGWSAGSGPAFGNVDRGPLGELSKPSSVTVGATLLRVELAIECVGSYLAIRDELSGMASKIGSHESAWIALLLVLVFIYGIAFFFVEKANTGRNWARITLLVLFVLGLVSRLPYLALLPGEELAMAGLLLVTYLIGLVLLFVPESNLWYAKLKARRMAELMR